MVAGVEVEGVVVGVVGGGVELWSGKTGGLKKCVGGEG